MGCLDGKFTREFKLAALRQWEAGDLGGGGGAGLGSERERATALAAGVSPVAGHGVSGHGQAAAGAGPRGAVGT